MNNSSGFSSRPASRLVVQTQPAVSVVRSASELDELPRRRYRIPTGDQLALLVDLAECPDRPLAELPGSHGVAVALAVRYAGWAVPVDGYRGTNPRLLRLGLTDAGRIVGVFTAQIIAAAVGEEDETTDNR